MISIVDKSNNYFQNIINKAKIFECCEFYGKQVDNAVQ